MPSFSVSGSAEDLSTPDDLWALLKELLDAEYRGMVSCGPDGLGGQVFSVEAHIDDPAALNGTRSITARIGDKKINIGGVISVMTPEAFAATYGGE